MAFDPYAAARQAAAEYEKNKKKNQYSTSGGNVVSNASGDLGAGLYRPPSTSGGNIVSNASSDLGAGLAKPKPRPSGGGSRPSSSGAGVNRRPTPAIKPVQRPAAQPSVGKSFGVGFSKPKMPQKMTPAYLGAYAYGAADDDDEYKAAPMGGGNVVSMASGNLGAGMTTRRPSPQMADMARRVANMTAQQAAKVYGADPYSGKFASKNPYTGATPEDLASPAGAGVRIPANVTTAMGTTPALTQAQLAALGLGGIAPVTGNYLNDPTYVDLLNTWRGNTDQLYFTDLVDGQVKAFPMDMLIRGNGIYAASPRMWDGPGNEIIVDSKGNHITRDLYQNLAARGFYQPGRASYEIPPELLASDGRGNYYGAGGAPAGGGGYGGGAYDTGAPGNDILDAERAATDAAVAEILAQKDLIQQMYADAQGDVYANYVREQKLLPEQLSDLATGTADSLMLQSALQYENNLADLDAQKLREIMNVQNQAAQVKAQGDLAEAQRAYEIAQIEEERRLRAQEAAAKAARESSGKYYDQPETEREVFNPYMEELGTNLVTGAANADLGAGRFNAANSPIRNDEVYWVRGIGRVSGKELKDYIAWQEVDVYQDENGRLIYRKAGA